MTQATNTAPSLTLHVSADGGWNWVEVTFSGQDADTIAADYIARKGHLVFDEADFFENQNADAFPLTVNALAPTCEHGMSLRLCAGPDHFPTREQEMAWEIF